MCLCFYNSRGDLQLLLACAATQLLSGPHSACVCVRTHSWETWMNMLRLASHPTEMEQRTKTCIIYPSFCSKVWGCYDFCQRVSYDHQDNTAKTQLFSMWIYWKCHLLLWCKAEFSVSYDPSEIPLICYFAAQETFIFVINVENGIFFKLIQYFKILWWIEGSKEQHFFDIFRNIVTFDQFKNEIWLLFLNET